MNTIDRDVVVIKSKQPVVDWANRDLAYSPPVSMEELKHDCTVILIPETDNLEEALEQVESLKLRLFEMELEDWSRDPVTWPKNRTIELFDAWFDLEVHSLVFDTLGGPVSKEDQDVAQFIGTWQVVSSPDLDDDYLYMETIPYVTLCQHEGAIEGKFQVGLITGSIFGVPDGDRVLFSFEATDEMDPVNGAGIITLYGERLVFQLLFHFGDLYTFECQPGRVN